MNGTHSPLGLNGRTPSPPSALPNSASNQQLPPACGARQLSKLKRFLTTLQQFGSDISPDIGERVRTLVLGLVVSNFYFFFQQNKSKPASFSLEIKLIASKK